MEITPIKPLSYNEFLSTNKLEDGAEAISLHSDELYRCRLTKAAELGISLDELYARHQTISEEE